jgi:fructokinase
VDLVCFGELLIDFVATASGSLRDAPGFIKAPGGAPANVAVAAARLGVASAFIGAVGKDEFGLYLRGVLEQNGVDVRALKLSARGGTPLAFVSLKENAERDFQFYWKGTADHRMKPIDVPVRRVGSARIFHYGSISFIHPATRRAATRAMRAALASPRTFVSCDPNLRLNLWPSARIARRTILDAIEGAHLVKINEEELEFLTGTRDFGRGIRAISRHTDAAVLVTMGPRGAVYQWGSIEGEASGFRVDAIDSTGAGDGFVAGFLRRMLENTAPLRSLSPDSETLKSWVRYANAVGALATTRRGAIPAFPAPEEVTRLISQDAG